MKGKNQVVKVISIVLVAALVIGIVYLVAKSRIFKEPSSLDTSYVQKYLEQSGYDLELTCGDSVYQISPQKASELLQLEAWTKSQLPWNFEAEVTLILGEDYEVRIDDSIACVFYGFSLIDQAYYSIPEEVAASISEYIAEQET